MQPVFSTATGSEPAGNRCRRVGMPLGTPSPKSNSPRRCLDAAHGEGVGAGAIGVVRAYLFRGAGQVAGMVYTVGPGGGRPPFAVRVDDGQDAVLPVAVARSRRSTAIAQRNDAERGTRQFTIQNSKFTTSRLSEGRDCLQVLPSGSKVKTP